jgi:hypothetical protein
MSINGNNPSKSSFQDVSHYQYIDEPDPKTELPKFKMLKMQHDIDNIAFMLKEHCESHTEGELSNRDLSIAVNNLVSRVNKIDNLDKIEPKPVGDSPLTLDQCEVGMQLECLAEAFMANLKQGDIVEIRTLNHAIWIEDKSGISRSIKEDQLKYFRIHKPAPAVVQVFHFIEDGKIPCGMTSYGNVLIAGLWKNVTCADCLKHKPKTLTPSMCVGRKIRILSTDFQGEVKDCGFANYKIGEVYKCGVLGLNHPLSPQCVRIGNYWFSAKDLECCELVPEEIPGVPKSPDIDKIKFPTMTLIDLATQYGMKLCTREEWDKLQSDRKEVGEKLEELITILDIASQIP